MGGIAAGSGSITARPIPEAETAIAVGLEAKALHFLLGCTYGTAKAGTEIGRIVLHFEDGSQADVPLVFAVDLFDWASSGIASERLAPDRVAWVGGRPLRVLYRKTWTNPTPGKRIASFDFISAKQEAAPFLVAVTAE